MESLEVKEPTARCLFIDERPEFFAVLAKKLGPEFRLDPTSAEAVACGEIPNDVDVIILGLGLPDAPDYADRMQALQDVSLNPSGIPVIAFLQAPNRAMMRDAVSAGAYDYFVQSSSLSELGIVLRRAAQFHALRREIAQLRSGSDQLTGFGTISTTDPNMAAVLRFAAKVASPDANILITGETGTGKEVLARAIHAASPRANAPFVAVACSSLPEALIEAELFGHEKGAFTGAVSMRRGRFEIARNGTIFLDEVGELTPTLQVKLLRVLQERKFERLGSNQQLPMEARVVCATHRDLSALTHAGTFRADLYYRLNTIEIELPPLRDRQDDIDFLASMFLQRYAKRHDRPARRFSSLALCAMRRYPWPGNIRELEHAIEHSVVVCDGPEIQLEHLPNTMTRVQGKLEPEMMSFESEVRRFKRQLVEKGLERSRNNKVQAARFLNISRSSLHRLIDELGIDERERSKEMAS